MRRSLRLATWNCRDGLDRKGAAVERLAADILVVQECRADPALAREPGVDFRWRDVSGKGFGVFAFNGWRLEPRPAEAELPWVLPLDAASPDGSFETTVLASWTLGRPWNHGLSYIRQVTHLIDAWEPQLRSGSAVIAGDLNCSADGTGARGHLANVARLEGMGVRSAYHHATGEAHGEETAMTLRWVGPGRRRYEYHCDFVFLPDALLERLVLVEVGVMAEWVEAGLSDHAPVLIELGGGRPDMPVLAIYPQVRGS